MHSLPCCERLAASHRCTLLLTARYALSTSARPNGVLPSLALALLLAWVAFACERPSLSRVTLALSASSRLLVVAPPQRLVTTPPS